MFWLTHVWESRYTLEAQLLIITKIDEKSWPKKSFFLKTFWNFSLWQLTIKKKRECSFGNSPFLSHRFKLKWINWDTFCDLLKDVVKNSFFLSKCVFRLFLFNKKLFKQNSWRGWEFPQKKKGWLLFSVNILGYTKP